MVFLAAAKHTAGPRPVTCLTVYEAPDGFECADVNGDGRMDAIARTEETPTGLFGAGEPPDDGVMDGWEFYDVNGDGRLDMVPAFDALLSPEDLWEPWEPVGTGRTGEQR
jgi:hypothetical protein